MPIAHFPEQRIFRITIPFVQPHKDAQHCGTALRQRGARATICLDINDVYEALAKTTALWNFSIFGMTRAEFIDEMSRVDPAAGSAIEGQQIALGADVLIEYSQRGIMVELPAIEFFKAMYGVMKRNGGFGTKAYCDQIHDPSSSARMRRETLARVIRDGLTHAVATVTESQPPTADPDDESPEVLPDFDGPSSPRAID